MNLASSALETTAVLNLCSGSEEVKKYLLGHLKDEYFSVPSLCDVYKRVLFLVRNHGKDIPSLFSMLDDMSITDDSKEFLKNHKNHRRYRHVSDAKRLISELNEYRIARSLVSLSQKTLDSLEKKSLVIPDLVNEYESVIDSVKTSTDMDSELIHIGKDGNADEIVYKILEGNTTAYVPTGFRQFDSVNGGFRKKGLVSIAATTSGGKALTLHSLIKVPNGWKRMGDMCVGDSVSTPDGGTASVTGVFPQGVKDVYRITFEDGRSCECCGDHLWKVYSKYWERKVIRRKEGGYSYAKIDNPWKVLSLKDIINIKSKRGLYIPLPKKIYGEDRDLPIDPYVLGCLLGDAYFGRKNIQFTNVDVDVLKTANNRLKNGYCLKKVRRKNLKKLNIYCLVKLDTNKDTVNYYNKSLISLELSCKKAWEKFIPNIYKEASYEQRLELVRGLMDTDGTASKGRVSYTTTSYQLALDMQYLIRSLGGLCKISPPKIKTYKYKGKIKKGRLSYNLSIRHDTQEMIFNLDRKKKVSLRKRSIGFKCKIKKIEYIGKEECQCIRIDHPDHLYITDDFIVTHNSAAAIQLLINMYRQGYNVAIVSLEMDQEEIMSRIISNLSLVDCGNVMRNTFSLIEKGRMDKEWKNFDAIGKKKENQYSIYTPDEDVTIQDVCYRLSRYNYEVLIVDYISLLNHRNNDEPWKALGDTARFMKRFVKAHDMVGILLCQLDAKHKIRYAGAIKEHSDVVWSWVYNREIAEQTGHIMTVDMQKARNQQVFPFRLSERFSFMRLEDADDNNRRGGTSSGSSSPDLDSLSIGDELEEY